MSDVQPPVAPTQRDAMYYNMNHPKRGMALIFNHENYEREYAERRTGTNIDCKNLMNCLEDLGFRVNVHHDLNAQDIEDTLHEVSGMDHTDHDCLVVAILTHGEVGTLLAYDRDYEINNLWSYFIASDCPSLAGKPKIFFIQACRGGTIDHGYKTDDGYTMRERTESNGSRTFRIPNRADFLIAYATIPGHYAWRIPSRGSWFVLALCSELNRNGRQVDLVTLLTCVNRRVALEYESHNLEDSDLHQKKQIPCITTMLTRLVRF